MKRIQELRAMDKKSIHEELRQLFIRSISLVVQKKDDKNRKSHLRSHMRRDIARIKTLITEKGW